jgi:hypothetical protein
LGRVPNHFPQPNAVLDWTSLLGLELKITPTVCQVLFRLFRLLSRLQEDPSMSETQGPFNGIRGFLWLAVGFLLLAAAIGSAIYIVVHLLKYL